MDVSGTPFDNYYETSFQPQQEENIAELSVRLYDVSEELEKARSIARIERQAHEGRMDELKRLLNATLRERDIAREELFDLKKRLAKHCSQDLKQSITSQGRIQWAENHLGGNSTSPPPVIDELHWDYHHNHLELPTKEDDDDRTPADQDVKCSNLAEKQTLYQRQQHENSVVFLDKQPEATDSQQPAESPVLRLVEDPITGQDVWQKNLKNSKAIGMSDTVPDTGCHTDYNHHGHLETTTGLIPIPPLSMPLHLPAPPEADMQVILKTRPEKGKFLQAVMEAGPLLQHILISSSLPRWRQPPPACANVETPIFRVGLTAPPFHVDHMQAHAAIHDDLYFHSSNFLPSPNLVTCTPNPSDFQDPLMHQAGSSSSHTGSSSVKFKPVFSTMEPDCVMKGRAKVPKFRPTFKSYQEKNKYLDEHNTLR